MLQGCWILIESLKIDAFAGQSSNAKAKECTNLFSNLSEGKRGQLADLAGHQESLTHLTWSSCTSSQKEGLPVGLTEYARLLHGLLSKQRCSA